MKKYMQGKMRTDLYQELYEVENTHWWHKHKRATVHQMIKKYITNKGSVLDIGSGTGKILEELKQHGWDVSGIDGACETVAWSKKRGITTHQVDFVKNKLPFNNDSYDLVLALDLLEHIPNDEQILQEMYRVLKPGGTAVITVPAYQWLYNYWDEMLGHQRRYSMSEIKKKIYALGWQITFASYYFCLFLIPTIFVRKIKKLFNKTGDSDFKTTPFATITVPIMNMYALFERLLLRFVALPFGLSLIFAIRKPYNNKVINQGL